METSTDLLSARQVYKFMTGAIVPRPIGWISTLSKDGTPNLAPFSYFNAVSSDPPTVMFSSGMRDADTPKDTLRNVQDTGEFVANIVTAELVEAMNASSIDAPHGKSEFDLAGVTPAPAQVVKAPRVLESPVHFECRVSHLYEVGNNVVVFGRVLHIHVDESVLLGGDKIDIERLAPVGRLAGTSYALIGEPFDLPRPKYGQMKKNGML